MAGLKLINVPVTPRFIYYAERKKKMSEHSSIVVETQHDGKQVCVGGG